MNWRTLVLSGALAASLNLSLISPVFADPPPWAGVWRHGDHSDRDWDDDDDRRERRREWRREHRNYDDRGYRGSGNRNYDAKCAQIDDRMRNDRNKINEIAPTGRHKKALQWYKDDMENARRDMANCRNQISYESYDTYEDPYGRYDNGRYDDRSYDPYSGSGDGSFDWKRDWPMLLGGFLNPQQ